MHNYLQVDSDNLFPVLHTSAQQRWSLTVTPKKPDLLQGNHICTTRRAKSCIYSCKYTKATETEPEPVSIFVLFQFFQESKYTGNMHKLPRENQNNAWISFGMLNGTNYIYENEYTKTLNSLPFQTAGWLKMITIMISLLFSQTNFPISTQFFVNRIGNGTFRMNSGKLETKRTRTKSWGVWDT